MEIKEPRVNLYDSNGYLNVEGIIETYPQPFIFITGARAIGKSYSSFKAMLKRSDPFFCLRRTETEAEIMSDPNTSQVASVARDMSIPLEFKKVNKLGSAVKDGEPVSFFGSLATFKNFRGIDLSTCRWLIYDECIPEIHTRKIKEEGLAFGNIYETINRNRELNGEPPLRVLFLSNSFNLANDIFKFFNIIDDAERLKDEGGEVCEDDTKVLILPNSSPISKQKETTAIYKATGQDFRDLAINNRFIANDFSRIRKTVNRQQYTGYCQVGPLLILKHKSTGELYAMIGKGTCRHNYKDTIADLKKFRRERGEIYDKYFGDKIKFKSYNAQYLLETYII